VRWQDRVNKAIKKPAAFQFLRRAILSTGVCFDQSYRQVAMAISHVWGAAKQLLATDCLEEELLRRDAATARPNDKKCFRYGRPRILRLSQLGRYWFRLSF
jgi:hypothetical protein